MSRGLHGTGPALAGPVLFFLAQFTLGSAAAELLPAQLSPDFLNAIDAAASPAAGPARLTGYIPPPVDLAHLKGRGAELLSPKQAAFQKAYDARTTAKTPNVADQGACAASWAFAACESARSRSGADGSPEFSANHLKNNHGFALTPCAGGNPFMAAAYMARWSGPAYANSDPYSPSSTLSLPASAQRHLQEMIILPGRSGSEDNAALKNAILKTGSAMSALHSDARFLNTPTAAYYCDNHYLPLNHMVTLIGWDDAYSRANFQTAPPADGAFLARDSRGTAWGDNGFFWISYHDQTLGRISAAITRMDPPSNYAYIHQHDLLGWTNSLGADSRTLWMGASFHAAAGGEKLEAVGFYTTDLNSAYELHIATEPAWPPSCRGPALQSGSFEYPGFHTVALSSPITLSPGQFFFVAVKASNSAYRYPIAIEEPVIGYSMAAQSASSQSYVSSDGAQWLELQALPGLSGSDVCLKAYGNQSDAAAARPVLLSARAVPAQRDGQTSLIIQGANLRAALRAELQCPGSPSIQAVSSTPISPEAVEYVFLLHDTARGYCNLRLTDEYAAFHQLKNAVYIPQPPTPPN